LINDSGDALLSLRGILLSEYNLHAVDGVFVWGAHAGHSLCICMYVTAQYKTSHQAMPDVAACFFTENPGIDAHFGASQLANRPAHMSMTNA